MSKSTSTTSAASKQSTRAPKLATHEDIGAALAALANSVQASGLTGATNLAILLRTLAALLCKYEPSAVDRLAELATLSIVDILAPKEAPAAPAEQPRALPRSLTDDLATLRRAVAGDPAAVAALDHVIETLADTRHLVTSILERGREASGPLLDLVIENKADVGDVREVASVLRAIEFDACEIEVMLPSRDALARGVAS